MAESLVRVGDVLKEHGFTRKELLYWERLGLVAPRYIGTHRAYGAAELQRLQTVRQLKSVGYTPKQLQAIFLVEGLSARPRVTEDAELRKRLEVASKRRGSLQMSVEDERAYNTAYKRLRRLASELGLTVETRKGGDKLRVKVTRAAKPKTAGGSKRR